MALEDRWKGARRRHGDQLHLPAGAICGYDLSEILHSASRSRRQDSSVKKGGENPNERALASQINLL